ncbi:hypothetical protein ACFXTN_034449 [Malus domestica]
MGAASFTCFKFVKALLKKWYVVSGKLMLRVMIADKLYQGNLALEVQRAMPLRFLNKQSCRGSGSRDSESRASSIFEKAIMLGVWLLRFGEWCLSIFEKVILLEVWLSRFGGRCFFNF